MALKKNSKVSAEFSMSSLTDIIFLLLIFFMLTSSMVIPNALNLKLPSSTGSSQSVTRPNKLVIQSNGTYVYNGGRVAEEQLEQQIRSLSRSGKNLTIAPHPKTENQYVVRVMDLAFKYKVSTVLAEPDN
jgi:biopolymer transport protein ExbD